jgi:SAM-dependent methyltransferase
MADGAATFQVAAEAYDRHAGRYGPELAPALIAAAGVTPGMRALDVGCGPGALTRELVALLGASSVVAIDPSAPFVEAIRTRLPGVDVSLGRGEALPYEDATFDAALAQLALNFMSDPPAGVREMRRVVRAGGVVAVAVWDYVGEMTLLRAFWDTVTATDPAGSAQDEGASMPYCTPETLGELFADVRPVVVSAGYDGFEDLWAPLAAGVGPAGAYVVALAADRRASFKEAFRDRLGVTDQPFRLTARAWIGVERT